MKTDILSTDRASVVQLLARLGEPEWRAGQIIDWAWRGVDFDGMTNLPVGLREKLAGCATINLPQIERKLVSSIDGTIKYLFRLSDGEAIESVVMRYRHGNTICISSQAGCRMGCRFCASNTCGTARNLRVSEMLGQVIAAQKDTGKRIDGIVLMGIGEPLDNYDNVLSFIRAVSSEEGLNIGCRHISLSTCGLADKIYRLADEKLQITLSVSLHACSDEERSALMPINNKWNIEALLRACRVYFNKTRRRISFEYTLIAGVNDTPGHAKRLSALLHGYFGRSAPFHVNLIALNEVEGRGYVRSDAAARFARELEGLRVNATVRRILGPDIKASCGQLRAHNIHPEPNP
ncbi:MAG: 23S rRNA (adenine(2503)-C(2))-methyltransferase RlmN [Eubacteriales bacterium]|jgi:23S rRNA (adenine2503-C2)-methyltransferase|nr:23S rRNA (adenine(2503)-C(2))-methyltransferase RlmN [Eubacteriales bacterium]